MKQEELLVLVGCNEAARLAKCAPPSIAPMMKRLGFNPLAILQRSGKQDLLWMPTQCEGLREYLEASRDPTMDRARLAKAVTTAKHRALAIIAKRHQTPETIC